MHALKENKDVFGVNPILFFGQRFIIFHCFKKGPSKRETLMSRLSLFKAM